MAKLRCPHCMGTDVYESRFVLSDLLFVLFGFPKRCNSCYHRFQSWKWGKKRSHGSGGRDRTKSGSGEIILPPGEPDGESGNSKTSE